MKKTIIPFVIGIVILVLLLWNLGFENIINLLSKTRVEYFLAAGIVYFILEISAAFNVKIALNHKLRLRKILPSHMCGMLYSALTPGRVGYYYTAFAISRKSGNSTSGNIGILTVIQGIYFFTKIFISLLAVVYFSTFILSQESQQYLILISILPIAFVIGIILALYTNLINRIFGRISFLQGIIKYIALMQEASRKIGKIELLEITAIGIIGWILMSFQWFLIAIALNINIDFITALMLQPLLTTIMFIPLSPSGLGVTEGGSALLFSLVLGTSYASVAGAAFMLLVRLNSIMVDSLGLIDMRIQQEQINQDIS